MRRRSPFIVFLFTAVAATTLLSFGESDVDASNAAPSSADEIHVVGGEDASRGG